MSAQVECYSGYTYAQEPRAFLWGGKRLAVQAVEKAWRTPAGPCFRILTEGKGRFELCYDEARDEWQIFPLKDIIEKDKKETNEK